MNELTLSLLGSFQADLNGRPIESFRTSKVQALLICISTEPGPHSRELLMTRLWPGMPENSARHNLRQTLYHLRAIVPDSSIQNEGNDRQMVPIFLANRQAIELNPEAAVTTDVHQFDQLIGGAMTHNHLDLLICGECGERLEKAVALYKGDFLADFYLDDSSEFEEWAEIHRETYRRKALDALEALTTISWRRKAYAQAQSFAQQQLAIDNLREGAYRQLMESLALGGQREEALQVYENARRVLFEDLGMAPTKRTTDIYEKIVAGDLRFGTAEIQGIRGYELKDEIGSGAYGSIHRAVQLAVGREVAVKVIRRKLANNPEFIRRFEAEAQLVARLEHPYIVPLYDYWRDPDGAYLVMRYLRGGNLLAALEKGPWQIKPAAKMLEQISGALAAAHQQGIIHRDIKPANILLDESGNSFLTDFGIAKDLAEDGQLTATGAIIGTPNYLSPEQILNEPVSPQTDIYSLGAVLYETLTGEKLFPDSSVANLLYSHLNLPVPLVSESRPGFAPQIDLVIQKAMAKNPIDRYEDVQQMSADFQQAIHGGEWISEPAATQRLISNREVENPYKGLRAFQEADAEEFFGREALVQQIIKRMDPAYHENGRKEEYPRFLALIGPSGSGKSSVVKAGIIPALRDNAIPGSEKWFITEMVPGTHPLEELELALWPIAVDPPPSLVEPMQKDIRGLLRTIRRIMPDEPGGQLLLIIDQFEELFTLVDDQRRRFFIDSLVTAINSPRCPLHIIITLRADFYDRPLQYEMLGNLIKENSEVVLPLTSAELSWAIREPARGVGVALEEGLGESVVASLADQPGALPLLQYAMTELFERREEDGRGGIMTKEAYDAIGGVHGALGRKAEEIYTNLAEDEKEAARQLFLRLVTLGEGVEDTRRRVLRAELEGINREQETENGKQKTGNRKQGTENSRQTNRDEKVGTGSSPFATRHTEGVMGGVIDSFGAARLLTFDRDPVTRGPTVEVAHEALLREWGRLRRWLDESRSDVRMQRQLARAAAEWLESNRLADYLLRGARLEQFAGWAETSTVALSAAENDYLQSSIEARMVRMEQEEARLQRELETAQRLAETEHARAEEHEMAAAGLRRRAYGLGVVLILAMVLAVTAVFFAQQSNRNANFAALREAEALAEAQARATSEAVAGEARKTAEEQAKIAFSRELAAAALSNLDKDPERSALLVLQALDAAQTLDAVEALHFILPNLRVKQVMVGHWDQINAVDWSPDNARIVTGSDDGTARVWDSAGGQELLLWAGHEARVVDVAYSKDGSFIVTAGDRDGTAKVWDASGGEEIHTLSGHRDQPNLLNPDESNWVGTVAISPDSKIIATGGADGTAKLWDAASGTEMQSFAISDEPMAVLQVAFTPDGSGLVIFGAGPTFADGVIKIVDLQSRSELFSLVTSPETSVGNFAISPDGKWLLVGDNPNDNKTVRLWDLETGTGQASYNVGEHNSLDFNPDGSLFVTNQLDGGARIWETKTGLEALRLSGHQDRVWEARFSPDGGSLATASAEGKARVWDIGPSYEALTLHPFSEVASAGVSAIELNPEGSIVATGGSQGGLALWDAQNGDLLQTLAGHDDYIGGLSFSADGRRLASAGDDHLVKLWDVATGELLFTFSSHKDWVDNVTFSPDGTKIATVGADKHAFIFDVATGAIIMDLPLAEAAWGVGFSPDGSLLATGDAEKTITIRDVESGQVLKRIFNENGTDDVVFNADGSQIYAGGYDGVVRIYDVRSGELEREILAHQGLVWGLAGSPDGQSIATAAVDGTIRLWDAKSGERLLTLEASERPLVDVQFLPDGTQIAAAGQDGFARFYVLPVDDLVALAKSRLTRSLTEEECRQYMHLEACPAEE